MNKLHVFSEKLGEVIPIQVGNAVSGALCAESGIFAASWTNGGWSNYGTWLNSGWSNYGTWMNSGWSNYGTWMNSGWSNYGTWTNSGWSNYSGGK